MKIFHHHVFAIHAGSRKEAASQRIDWNFYALNDKCNGIIFKSVNLTKPNQTLIKLKLQRNMLL